MSVEKEGNKDGKSMPQGLLRQIYDATGSLKQWKGFILICCNDDGELEHYIETQSDIMKEGLINYARYMVKDHDDHISPYSQDEEEF